jgi:6-methylsalicylate decarboxylase
VLQAAAVALGATLSLGGVASVGRARLPVLLGTLAAALLAALLGARPPSPRPAGNAPGRRDLDPRRVGDRRRLGARVGRGRGDEPRRPAPDREVVTLGALEKDRSVAATDIHQHLWPEPFLAALSARSRPPLLRGRELELEGEPVWELDVESHDLDTRLALLDRLELDRAVVCLQPTLGLERLPAGEAHELAAIWERGILELAASSRGRILPLAASSAAEGFVGLCVSGIELLDLDALAPRLDALVASGGFLFVHPGGAVAPPGAPSWWTAIVDYTAQMQAAYVAWFVHGAERWPDLDVVFAILAGGAPIQLERMAARGVNERRSMLPRLWFDTATYGRRALDLTMSMFGVDRMLFGSDVPVVDPAFGRDAVRSFGDAVADAVVSANPDRLLRR